MLKVPTIILNVKTYAEATGVRALEIAQLMDKISQETGASMAVAVQATDISTCAKKVNMRMAAFMLAIKRVLKVFKERGVYA